MALRLQARGYNEVKSIDFDVFKSTTNYFSSEILFNFMDGRESRKDAFNIFYCRLKNWDCGILDPDENSENDYIEEHFIYLFSTIVLTILVKVIT